VPLEEAAQKFDSAYRLLLSSPPDEISTPDGLARVTERHSCAYGERRFGYVIMVGSGELAQLSRAVSVPLVRRLEVALVPARDSFASLQFQRPSRAHLPLSRRSAGQSSTAW
jgi:hypothetical protein